MAAQNVTLSDGCTLLVKILNPTQTTKPLFIIHHSALGAADHTETESAYSFLITHSRVLVYDARGCGISDAQEPLENDRWVEDIEELRQWANAETIYLCGNSYGALICLLYAVKYASKVRGLLLRAAIPFGPFMKENALHVASTTALCTPDMERQMRLWSGTLRDHQDYADALGEIGPLFTFPGKETVSASTQVEEEGRNEAKPRHETPLRVETHNAAFKRSMPFFDVRERLKDITAPTLVTVGRYDWLTPVECAEEIQKGIPRAELAVFEHSCHSPPVETPEEFQTTVEEWIRRLKI